MISYATFAQFTAVHSLQGVSQAQIESHWLPWGAEQIHTFLGGVFSVPFSSNNASARLLNIDFAYLGILERTRKAEDSEEMRESLMKRIEAYQKGQTPMLTESGQAVWPGGVTGGAGALAGGDYRPTFDMREPIDQSVDPSRLRDLFSQE